MTTKLGVQVTPWKSSADLIEMGVRLAPHVDTVWVQDQMLARNVYVLMGALAQAGVGIGTDVTYPTGRNPIEMASAAATLGELVTSGRELTLGMGTGGALVNSLFEKDRPLTMMRESLRLIRALWAGGEVPLDDYPTLGQRIGFKAGAVAHLTYPVERPPQIVMAGVGPKILALAGEHADGLISASNLPTLSLAAFRTGEYAEISGLSVARAARPAGAPPLRLIFGINLSISRDREHARDHARRQATLSAGNPRLWPGMRRVGLDLDSAEAVHRAFEEGLGVEGASRFCSAAMSDALIIAGTPEECIPKIAELRDLATAEGYTEFYLGAPLGPDPREATDLLISDVIPAVWPEQRDR